MIIRLINNTDAEGFSKYFLENRQHFKLWEPEKTYNFDSVEEWQQRLQSRLIEQKQQKAAYFVAFDPATSNIFAHCNLTQIFMGPFRACYMGYGIAQAYEGKGYMLDLCRFAIDHAFSDLKLHRIMANYLPHNNRSARLLKRLGFTIEGRAKDYLKINGRWEDHMLTSLTNPAAV